MALLLFIISLVLYGIDYIAFGHAPDIAAGFLGNCAFLPIYVLFVTLVIERVIREREVQVIRQKLNMVIGLFFSEVGTDLIRALSGFILDPQDLVRRLQVTDKWGNREFNEAGEFLSQHRIEVDSRKGELTHVRDYLIEKKGLLLGLLENPNLMEHDVFTDLLWAVSHLMQELELRKSLTGLHDTDLNHLSGDIQRAYSHLLREWLFYMKHLKSDYPYLYSLAVRMNPMGPNGRPEVV
jgi:hypothetical protein